MFQRTLWFVLVHALPVAALWYFCAPVLRVVLGQEAALAALAQRDVPLGVTLARCGLPDDVLSTAKETCNLKILAAAPMAVANSGTIRKHLPAHISSY